MLKSIRIALALLCMVCLLVLLIAPLVDPPVTRLLSDSIQLLMLCWLVAAACFLFLGSLDRTSRLSLSVEDAQQSPSLFPHPKVIP